jgi:hypothetical protein
VFFPWLHFAEPTMRKIPSFHPVPKTAIAFKPEFLDFDRGIRVGNLEDDERITRLLKSGLEHRFQQPFVTERWGRGVFWQWIGYLPRANRAAKPISSHVSFGCAKFFVEVDTGDKLFKCGLQVERGYLRAPRDFPHCELRGDWDWNRLLGSLRRGSPMLRELERLVDEGFFIHAGSWEKEPAGFSISNPPSAVKLRQVLTTAPGNHWAGFQLYYPMNKGEVEQSTGLDLIESMIAVFGEVTHVMNLCMQVRLDEKQRQSLVVNDR